MNTDTGNIFALDGKSLADNEVELTGRQFAELFPIRDLKARLDAYQRMTQQMKPTEFPEALNVPTWGSVES